MLAQRELDPELKRQLGTIYQQAMRAHEMISDMMLFARPPKPTISEMPIDRFFEKLLDRFRDRTHLSTINDTNLEKFACDASQLLEAFSALIENAMEANDSVPHIKIQFVELSTNSIGIRIEDDGPGVSGETRRHMFDPFYSGREAGRGLGFGLSKAWTIAQIHGGDLTLEKWQDGCAFLFRLPADPIE